MDKCLLGNKEDFEISTEKETNKNYVKSVLYQWIYDKNIRKEQRNLKQAKRTENGSRKTMNSVTAVKTRSNDKGMHSCLKASRRKVKVNIILSA